MKNNLLKASLLVPALLISACGAGTGSSEKLYPNSVLQSKWGLEAAKASYDVLGVAIPYIENESFTYEVGVDDYGDPDIWFYCYYNTDDEAYKAYADYLTICADRGYSGQETTYSSFDPETFVIMTFEYCVVDRVIGENQGVELQFVTSTKEGKPCLGIYGFSYLYIEEHIYPQLAINQFYGEESAKDIPQIKDDSYRYYFSFFIQQDGTRGLEVQSLGCDFTVEKYFYNELIKNGFGIVQYSDEDDDYMEVLSSYEEYMYGYYYYAVSNDKILIFFYDIETSAFVVDMYHRTQK